MRIACTAKAKELLKSATFQNTNAEAVSDFFSWHAHVYLHRRHKILVLINDLTGFPVILYRPRVTQLKNFELVAEDAIREAFLEYGVKPEHVDRYFNEAGQIELHAKTTRGILSRLTQWKDILTYHLDSCTLSPFVENQLSQPAFARKVFPISWTDYDHTPELFTKAFGDVLNIADDELFAVESYELQIQLKLENHEVKRKVVLPANATLDQLHDVIQRVFGWADSHLHQFLLLPKGAPSIYEKTDVTILNADPLNDDDCIDDSKPFLIDATTTIKDAFNKPYELWYEYDFGDSWVHKISLEAVYTLTVRQFRLIEAIGDCPPEDVGGEGGYEEFLKVISDEKNPERNDLLDWYAMQTNDRLSFDEINYWLDNGRLV